ncbi:MAG: AAA family ATPase [Gemmatimonadota bacterium]|nr:AAA family ATPase [Gemmatimonadota bacterium]
MSEKRQGSRLHLADLSIEGFRGIEKLSIPRLGRVTLLTGRNSVGKTTVLDAVRVYAARGSYRVLCELLEYRDEFANAGEEESGRKSSPDIMAIFHGRDVSRRGNISIGPSNTKDRLRIEAASLDAEQTAQLQRVVTGDISDVHPRALNVKFQGSKRVFPEFFAPAGLFGYRSLGRNPFLGLLNQEDPPTEVVCLSTGPNLLSNEDMARFWDAVALTDDEDMALASLRLILDNEVDRVAVIGDNKGLGRRVVVKLHSEKRPVPLKSLGDGPSRLFSVALALANSRDGFLLIDESENGIHHSVQRDYWRMVLETADKNNVQVLATTHSYDCVRGFAQAATEFEGVDGILVRVERKQRGLRAVEYSERNLRAVAKQPVGVEVR